MIASFADKDMKRLFADCRMRRFQAFEKVARRKLAMLDAAADLADLKVPPGNWFESFSGNGMGQYSIRINGQWQICFRWVSGQARDV